MIDELARQLKDRRLVLFAGAGLSLSLGLPSWADLMAHMAADLGHEPDELLRPGADYLQLAEYYRLEKSSIGPLRSWMDRQWHVDDDALRASRVHNQLVDLDFPLIYTTNYDRNIERTFELRGRPFAKVISVLDVARAPGGVPHIVKFHGDFEDDDSLVLAESDYFERLAFESPLDIKFRSDVLGRGILFVGYSLADLNLRLLLYRLQRMWEQTRYAGKRPQSWIFLLRPDKVQERVLESRGVRAIVAERDDPETALPDFFDRLLERVRELG